MATSKHFTDAELSCKCGCGINLMDSGFLARLEKLRLEAGDKPLTVTSGYRCPWYNSEISSTGPDGPHTTGKAIDFAIGYEPAYRLVKLALSMGFKGIGIAQKGAPAKRFIHLDILEENRPRIWTY